MVGSGGGETCKVPASSISYCSNNNDCKVIDQIPEYRSEGIIHVLRNMVTVRKAEGLKRR